MKKKLFLQYLAIIAAVLVIATAAVMYANRMYAEESSRRKLQFAQSAGLFSDKGINDNTLNSDGLFILQKKDGSYRLVFGKLPDNSTEASFNSLHFNNSYSRINLASGTYMLKNMTGTTENPASDLIYGTPVYESYNDPQRILSYCLLGSTIILISLLYFAHRMSERITRPLKEIREATGRISGGELNHRIRISDKGELSEIVNNFNYMADRMEETIVETADRQNRVEAVLTSMNSGVIALDRNDSIIIFNPYAGKLFGVFENVIGKDIRSVLKKEITDELLKVKPDFSEITIERNEDVTLRYKTAYIKGEDSKKAGLVIVIQDITEYRKLEQMRSQFVANVSHELKTPLTSIKGFSETLIDMEDNKTKIRFLEIIDQEAERLKRLIEDILSLSSIENQESDIVEVVNASEVLKDTCALLEPTARNKHIDFSLTMMGTPVFIGDTDRFRQLIINLVDNAIKYTETGGKVKVRLDTSGKNLVLSVSDTGSGIPKEHIPRIFERFYRVDKARDRAKGGTGLGLAIVKHIVMAFDGTIDVRSEEGVGTVFTVEIPLYKGDPSKDNIRR